MQPDYQKKARLQRTIGIIAIVIIVAAVAFLDHVKGSGDNTISSSGLASGVGSSTAASSTVSSDSTSSVNYKDGTYTASSKYSVPHNYESIAVTLAVKNGTVSSSNIVNSESDPESAQFQEDFAAEYQSSVVGRSLNGLKLDSVAGASDTTSAFNKAVEQIRSQAQ